MKKNRIYILSATLALITCPLFAAPATWKNIPGAIYFYQRNKPYYEFTNFYEAKIKLDGKVWPTTEQYFQAKKFPGNRRLQDRIRRFKSDRRGSAGRKAFTEAQKHPITATNWDGKRKLDVMLRAVRAKFRQPKLKGMLLRTGNKVLVEDAGQFDNYWGAGPNYQGGNHLGQILMHVRHELRTGKKKPCYAQSPSFYIQLSKKRVRPAKKKAVISRPTPPKRKPKPAWPAKRKVRTPVKKKKPAPRKGVPVKRKGVPVKKKKPAKPVVRKRKPTKPTRRPTGKKPAKRR